jgi:hypothetical protein
MLMVNLVWAGFDHHPTTQIIVDLDRLDVSGRKRPTLSLQMALERADELSLGEEDVANLDRHGRTSRGIAAGRPEGACRTRL